MFQLDLAAVVDQGLVRESNQDVARVVPGHALALVADGMGGHARGELASQTAADVFEQCFERLGGAGSTIDETHQRILQSFHEANLGVGAHPAARRDGAGMGTTLVAAAFAHGHVVVAHVGDSRCYRLRDGVLELLTEDHSYASMFRQAAAAGDAVAGAMATRWANVLTRAVSGDASLEVDTITSPCEPGDVYLLCSDGLWGMVDADALVQILTSSADADDACTRLIGAAWAGGGLDNIGVAVVRLERRPGCRPG